MKKILLIILISAVMLVPLTSMAGITTFTASRKDFNATITLTGTDKIVNGKKAIAYRLVLKSKTCHSVLSGIANFYSNTDWAGDDSMLLPNGSTVKINTFRDFRDTPKTGDVDLFVDVQSRIPQSVHFSVTSIPPVHGSCVPAVEGVQIEFYSPEAYKK